MVQMPNSDFGWVWERDLQLNGNATKFSGVEHYLSNFSAP